MKTISHRFWSKTLPILYVESIKVKTGDWGYTTNPENAISLTPYQQKMFLSDCLAVGIKPVFITI